jgi:hypothetical protein
VVPGGEVVVTVTASGYGPFGGVVETLPAGFGYESSSLSDSAVRDSGQTVTFLLFGESSFTYTVTASDTAGDVTASDTVGDVHLLRSSEGQ